MARGARVIPDMLAIAAGVEPSEGPVKPPGRLGGLTIVPEGGKDPEQGAGRRH
jgi:hypothetical protein